jgi:sulfonate transport system substrate-binding protein
MLKRLFKQITLITLSVLLLVITGCGSTSVGDTSKTSPTDSTVQASSLESEVQSSSTDSTAQSSTNGETQDKNIVIRYGYQPGHSQVVIADKKGFFKEEFEKDNITFEFSKFQAGPALITSLTAGQLDFGQVGDQPALSAKANNVDLKIIGKYISSNQVNSLLATKTSGIKAVGDIKGKRVGVTIGSTCHQLLYIYLESVNLKPSDIQQVNLQPGDIVSSLISGNIDAAVTWEPYVSITIAKGVTNKIADGVGYKKEVDVIIANNPFLQQHPDVSARILKVLDKAGKWIKENQEEALKLVGADAGVEPAVLAPMFSKVAVDDVSLNAEDIEAIKKSQDFLRKYGLIKKDVDVNSLVDTKYLQLAGLQK